MTKRLLCGVAVLSLAGCATTDRAGEQAAAPIEVRILAFNDFHGNLEPPRQAVSAPVPGLAEPVRVPAGGAAYFATALARLRAEAPNSVTVSAGDMIGASPLVSSVFLDEPTIHAMNLMRVDFNAVGNHEFDRGRAELLRIQNGGCAQHGPRRPCQLEPFPGARFRILAANVLTESGETLLPASGMRSFGRGAGQVRIAFIGLTLRETPTLVTPSGVEGLTFADEAETINALVPRLRAEGADAIVVLIHQGAAQPGPRFAGRAAMVEPAPSCETMEGDLMPILARLDPEVDLVVSGHTHNAYICDYSTIDPTRPFLVTSAGRYGTALTSIRLTVDPARGVTARRADNVIVQGEAFRGSSGEVPVSGLFPSFPRDPAVGALVDRYAAAADPLAARVVGRFTGPATREASPAGETVLGDLVADAQLAATRAPEHGGARIAFMNGSGVRAEIVPAADGSVTYGHIYAAQPFGNSLVVKTFTGRQIRRLLEQQFASGWNTVERPNMLMPSRGLSYAFDLSRREGQRILDLTLDGQPIRDEATYRVTMNSFLATGGDNFTIFRDGTNVFGGPQDLDAFEAYLAAAGSLTPPAANRITNRTPRP
ncbi:MAG TPA: bifunctional metallophosphatase/5'-nucleotidase [Allosphingosinicella sp.]|nr:bifunctional metallophosphatase/5'-nucleotidase [Allosphingosinicella sp.]